MYIAIYLFIFLNLLYKRKKLATRSAPMEVLSVCHSDSFEPRHKTPMNTSDDHSRRLASEYFCCIW